MSWPRNTAAEADLSRIADLAASTRQPERDGTSTTTSDLTRQQRAHSLALQSLTSHTVFSEHADGQPGPSSRPSSVTNGSISHPSLPARTHSAATVLPGARHSRSSRSSATNDVVNISSSDSSEDDSLEVTSVHRVYRPVFTSSTLGPLSPHTSQRRYNGPVRSDTQPRMGVSVHPSTNLTLQHGNEHVAPSNDDAESGFSFVAVNPSTDQRIEASNLSRPTTSPPRQKPPPMERPLLSKFRCPICFEPPAEACLTPCGHLFCGNCLFQTLKSQEIRSLREEAMFQTIGPSTRGGIVAAGRGYHPPALGRLGVPSGGIGGRAAGRRVRSRRDPLAGHCPVCRSKINGFAGRNNNGVLGLRVMIGKPVNDSRDEVKARSDDLSDHMQSQNDYRKAEFLDVTQPEDHSGLNTTAEARSVHGRRDNNDTDGARAMEQTPEAESNEDTQAADPSDASHATLTASHAASSTPRKSLTSTHRLAEPQSIETDNADAIASQRDLNNSIDGSTEHNAAPQGCKRRRRSSVHDV